MDPVPARHAGAVRPRCALLRRRLEGGARRCRQHGPAGRHRHQRRLRPEPLSMVGDAGRADAAPVFRGLGGGHRPGAAGQIPGKPRQAPDQRGDPGTGSLASGPRDTGDRRPRGRRRHRRAAPGRPGAGQAWRAFPGGRRSGRGRKPGRRSADQRREPAGEQGARRPHHRWRDQRRGSAAGAHHRARWRDCAGADHPPGGRRPGGQGTHPEAGGQGQPGVRPGGAGDRRVHPDRLVAHWRAGRGRADQCGGGAGDRLPLRARPGDTGGDHGRHRRGGTPRHPDQGRRGPGSRPCGECGGLRQDRHADLRQAADHPPACAGR